MTTSKYIWISTKVRIVMNFANHSNGFHHGSKSRYRYRYRYRLSTQEISVISAISAPISVHITGLISYRNRPIFETMVSILSSSLHPVKWRQLLDPLVHRRQRAVLPGVEGCLVHLQFQLEAKLLRRLPQLPQLPIPDLEGGEIHKKMDIWYALAIKR